MPQTQARGGRRRCHQTPSLPLDMITEIAARSDPATLVRCAATCTDMRGRVRDPAFLRSRLRLRHAAGSFVPSLLRGHLAVQYKGDYTNEVELNLVEIAAAAAAGATARPVTDADGFPRLCPDGKTWRMHSPVASRDGLLLVRSTDWTNQGQRPSVLRVCDPATGCSRTLPPEPVFPGDTQPRWEPYVLLVGEGEGEGEGGGGATGISRPFQVLKANLAMAGGHRPYLETQTFSSETGAWGPYAETRTPHLYGKSLLRGGRPLVSGGAVHWLCVTDSESYVLKLDIKTAQVSVTALPVNFPRPGKKHTNYFFFDYLLATATAGGSPIVLVAEGHTISAWTQTTKVPAKWKPRPQVLIESDAILRSWNVSACVTYYVQLHWFAERSGLVLVGLAPYGFFWLDLRSMEIVRYFKDNRTVQGTVRCPLEMDLSSWVPNFSSTL